MDEETAQVLNEARKRHPRWHHCKDCDKWYGAEDDEYGPCMYKDARGDDRFVTHGSHPCDEPEELRARGLL
ncbi:MAG: hypothetical protein ACE5EW_06840 [Thermoplasmata archaeon]